MLVNLRLSISAGSLERYLAGLIPVVNTSISSDDVSCRHEQFLIPPLGPPPGTFYRIMVEGKKSFLTNPTWLVHFKTMRQDRTCNRHPVHGRLLPVQRKLEAQKPLT
jgi:hypothetical protein